MTEQENVQLVRELYAAFGRGDVPAILDQLTDDARGTTRGRPRCRTPAATAAGKGSAGS